MMTSKILSFFSTKSVKEKIAANTLSGGQLFLYFYFILMYDAIGLTQQCLSVINKQPTLVDMVNIYDYVIITGIGLLILFFANGGSKGKNFLSKFFAFSFTVGFKYGVLSVVLDALSPFVPLISIEIYEISMYLVLNILMVGNIAYRMYETRPLSS